MAPVATADLSSSASFEPSVKTYETLKPFLTAAADRSAGQQNAKASGTEEELVIQLSDEELAEINNALESCKDHDRPLHTIDPSTFPLPYLSHKLRALGKKLQEDQDCFLLSGLRPDRYSPLENIIIQTGVCSHIGGKRGMPGAEGGDKNVIHHITPLPMSLAHQLGNLYHAPPNQSRDIPFHSDIGQIVSLFTQAASTSGGRFYLARNSKIVEQIQLHCPEFLTVLKEPWCFIPASRQAEESPLQRPLLFTSKGGKPVICCSRARLTGTPTHPRPSNIPALTEKQVLALDALHYFGHAVARPFDFKAGDMLFFNNMTTMHARDKFSRSKGGAGKKTKQRHLTRLIVRDEEDPWYVPEALQEEMDAAYDHDPAEEHFQIEKALFSWEASH